MQNDHSRWDVGLPVERKLAWPPMTFARFFAMLALVALACSNPRHEKAKHLERGREYLAAGNVDGAILELRNVVQIDPRDVAGRYELAQAYLEKGDAASANEARVHLQVVVQEDPNHLEARIALADLYLEQGDAAAASEHAQAAARLAPADPRVSLRIGRSLLAKGDLKAAVPELRKSVKANPKDVSALVYLARAMMARDDLRNAQQLLERATKLDSKSSLVEMARGSLHELRGEDGKAEQAYRQALRLAPGNDEAFLTLSGFLRRTGRQQAAESVYRNYAKAKPQDARAQLALASFYAAQKQYDKAEQHIRKALELEPDSAVALDRLLDLKLETGKVEDVRAELQKLRDANADHPVAKYYEARIELRNQNFDKGIKALREVTQEQPNVGGPHLTLGMALAASGDREGAARALQAATSEPTVAANAFWALAKLHLDEDKPRLAAIEARNAQERAPGNVSIVITYAEALARSGEVAKAITLLETTAKRHPKDPAVSFALGRLTRARGDLSKAIAHYEQTLEIDPKLEQAAKALIGVHLKRKDYESAHQKLDELLKNDPNNTTYRLMKGWVFEASSKPREAEAEYVRVMNSAKVVSDAYSSLATLHLRQKEADAAIERYLEMLKENPKQVGPHVVVGMLFHAQGKIPQAREHYEAAVKLSPHAGIAANNLADILAGEGKDLDRALELAVMAYRERPDDASVLDTMGWLQHRKKNHPQAASLLATAHRLRPRDPVIAYHYGMALAATKGRKADAKKVLQNLLDHAPNFPDAERVRQTLAKL